MTYRQWVRPLPAEGIYFNMPFQEYKDIHCLNSGFIKDLNVDVTYAWLNSYYNPHRPADKDTPAKRIGRAYHKRILEGKDAFYQEYAPEFQHDLTDKSIIRTSEDLKSALALRGLPVTFKVKQEGIDCLLAADPSAKIADVMRAEHDALWQGREQLPVEQIQYLEYCTQIINADQNLRTYTAGGYPEVVVVWYDEFLDAWFKIRVDYMKTSPFVDLKTFANQKGLPIDLCISRAFRDYKYGIQARLYLQGMAYARKFAREYKIYGGNPDPDWLKAFGDSDMDEFWFLFLQKEAPVVRGRKYSLDSSIADVNFREIEEMVKLHHHCYETFGEGIWLSSEIPQYITEDQFITGAK
jgi:hypothetical protein